MRRWGQLLFLLLSLFLIIHGLIGPQFAPKNLTTLFLWVHYRGLLVLTLLLLGNFFCQLCPFILLRDFGRKFWTPRWNFPKLLQNKWPSIALFVAVLFSYEYFDLWASPHSSALLILSAFLLAFATDMLFRKASFCKYLCPIGQFNFLSSAFSPTEVRSKDPAQCSTCTSYDCLHGNPNKNGDAALGCELDLFIPNKVGNMDCTLCMNCLKACPHDNVELAARAPAMELWQDPNRSGLGKLGRRRDYAALVIVFTFGAILNAFGMVGPSYRLLEEGAKILKTQQEFFLLALLFILFLLVIPLILLKLANFFTQVLLPENSKTFFHSRYFISTLLPLGFGVWLAHYSFHFLTGALTFVPILTGKTFPIAWMGLSTAVVMPMQFGVMIFALIGSWAVAWILLQQSSLEKKRLILVFLPWGTLHLLLFFFSVWLFSLPMEMRGTFLGG